MERGKVDIHSSSPKVLSSTVNLDRSYISSNPLQGLNLDENNLKFYKNLENDINNSDDLNYKNNSELNPQNNKKTNYIIRRIIPLTILLGAIFYMNHISEKKNFDNSNNQRKAFSPNSCILEVFPDDFYKATWKFFIVNKNLKNFLLTVLFYFYDLIFFIASLYWILNIKKENWSFLFSVFVLAIFKYFALEFYLMKNHEDTLWRMPNFPFFLTIQNANNNDNNFFSSSTTLFLIIIKQLNDNKLKILKNITFLILILNVLISLFLRIQSLFGIVIGMVLGLYLNKISDDYSKVFKYIYSFEEQKKRTSKEDTITYDFENKIKENIEKIIKNKKYIELKNNNERNQA